jgi:4-diphosphocytidyl-2C-methyl-D-erythritol kinase
MSGSGTTVFGFFAEEQKAKEKPGVSGPGAFGQRLLEPVYGE